MKRLWLIQAVGNALLFWCAFTWLGIRDSKGWQLTETAVFGVMIAALWLWLQNGTFVYCGDRAVGLWKAFRASLKTLAVFAVVVVAFVLIVWAVGRLEDPLMRAGQRTASWLTFHLRRPVKPATWVHSYLAVLWGLRWIVLPALSLPIAAAAARKGWHGMWCKGRRVFWLEYLIALALGCYLPTVLMGWVPKLTGTATQVLSFVLRFGIAYGLIITAWLATAFFASAVE
jgi:hypothetical protein